MADTGEIDAIAWSLITIPPQYPATFFKKAAQMTSIDSIGRHYRPRLLESLMPLLTPLITSHRAPEHHSSVTHSPQSDDDSKGQPRTSLTVVDGDVDEDLRLKNLNIYIACLARLSEFTDYEGTFWCLREDARQHPKLERPLIDKLVELANPLHQFQDGLRDAAAKVLNNYELNMEGNPLRSPTTVLGSIAAVPRNAAISMSNDDALNSQEQRHSELYRPVDPATHVEPVYLSEGIQEVECGIREKEVEEVRHAVGDKEVDEVRREIGNEEIEEEGMVKKNDLNVVNRKTQEKGFKMDVDVG